MIRQNARFLSHGIAAVALVLLICLAAGCRQGSRPVKVSFKTGLQEKRMMPDTTRDTPLQFAISTMISPEETVQYYKKIFDYVAHRLGRQYVLIQKNSYSQVNDLFREGSLDLAFVSSGPYVELARNGGAELVAVPVVDGSTTYYSMIVTPASSDVKTFGELRGRTFAFVDPLSNSGRLFPMSLVFKTAAGPNEYFRSYTYTYSHSASIHLVADGNVDGAAVSSQILKFLTLKDPSLKQKIKVIGHSPAYANSPFIVPQSMDPKFKNRIRDILLHMHENPEGRLILQELNMQKFTIIPDKAYDAVRALYKDVSTRENARE